MDTASHQFAGALMRLCDDKELFQELILYFREDAPRLLAAIRAGSAAGSDATVVRAAHSLRGLLASFDAEKAMAIAGSIEELAGRVEPQSMSRALAELEIEIQSLQRALNRYRLEVASPAGRK